MVILRPANADGLPEIFDLLYAHEIAGEANPPQRGDVPANFRHLLATGGLVVAQEGGSLLGYAGVVTRGPTAYLTDLFGQRRNLPGSAQRC